MLRLCEQKKTLRSFAEIFPSSVGLMRRLNVFDRNTTLALLAKQTLTDVELELIRVIDHLSGLRAPDARAPVTREINFQ